MITAKKLQNKSRALVIEGGGMRSAYVAGALLALHQKKPLPFDLVVGTSAGACCAANFLADQPELNQFVLEKKLSSKRFINLAKIPSRQNIMDIDYLIDECFESLESLKEKLQRSPTTFLITATDCQSGQPIYFDAAQSNIKEALRASCAIPYFYRKKLFYQGNRIMDGGLSVSIPIAKAMESGAKDITVICSRPQGYQKKKSLLGLVNYLFFPQYPQVAKALWQRHQSYNQELALLEKAPTGIKILSIRPQSPLGVSRLSRNQTKISQAIKQGHTDANKVLA